MYYMMHDTSFGLAALLLSRALNVAGRRCLLDTSLSLDSASYPPVRLNYAIIMQERWRKSKKLGPLLSYA